MRTEQATRERINCPNCQRPHIDVGEWAYKRHHTHLCLYCCYRWRMDRYVFGIDPNKISCGFPATEYAKGFNNGCNYSKIQITALENRVKVLQELASHCNIWLKAALECESFNWSSDQELIARKAELDLRLILDETKEEK